MNYKRYAQILVDAEKDEKNFPEFFNKFINILKKKDEIKLLPNILLEIEKLDLQEKKNKKTKIILKDKSFSERYEKEVKKLSEEFDTENLIVEENSNVIGGYILKNKNFKIDKSYKKSLLEIHKRILS